MNYVVGGVSYTSKRAVEDRCREILRAHEVGEAVDASELRWVLDLLARHHDAERKVGAGVAAVTVELTEYKQRCFWITRVDGTRTDFSFKVCLTPNSPWRNFTRAMRAAVVSQVIKFRDEAFAKVEWMQCPLSGDLVTKDTAHVDHAAPDTFDALVRVFLGESGTDYKAVELGGTGDGETDRYLADQSLLGKWQDFHAARAKLRILSARGNLSIARIK